MPRFNHFIDIPMRSHNSIFPRCFTFNGKLYDSASQLHQDALQAGPVVKLASFYGRVRRLALANNLSESAVTDALMLNASEYTARYATRKTWVTVDGQLVSLCDYFDQSRLHRAVSYPNFRTRVKSLEDREMLDSVSMNDGLHMPYGEWVSFYGGGRAKTFQYHGDEYPDQSGNVFRSIAAFLRQTGRYGDRQLIWSRLEGGWSLNNALIIPATISSLSPGLIYLLTRKSTGEVYVGLTVCGLEQRWAFHVLAARKGSTTKLARAIREDGGDGFTRDVLQDDILDTETLRKREIFWATERQALGANGLNTLKPGGLGGPRGKKTTANGQTYRSLNERARCEAKALKVPFYVVRPRITKDLPIPLRPRSHSKHPDAGSILWRKWQAMLRRYPKSVVESWTNSYDTFKADVSFKDSSLHLVRPDAQQPWGPYNCEWLTPLQKIERQHGKSICCAGILYPSLKSLAQAYGIGVSTLKDRIRRQCLSVENAVAGSSAST
jgi:hypothetical protein